MTEKPNSVASAGITTHETSAPLSLLMGPGRQHAQDKKAETQALPAWESGEENASTSEPVTAQCKADCN